MAAVRSIKKRIAATLGRSGYTVVDSPEEPLKIHSHCAGMDAVASSFKLLGITIKSLATEADVPPAIFHLMHHRDKTEHLVADVKWVAQGLRGPCFLHGGMMCQWDRGGWQLVFSSFVCKPYSRASGSRVKSMTPDEGDHRGIDTYHHTKTIIKKYQPVAFVLENVDGVNYPHPEDAGSNGKRRKKASPADFMLEDLKSAGYDVVLLTNVKATDFGICQSRPRTLFFGVRLDQAVRSNDIADLFKKFAHEYKQLCGPPSIDDFVLPPSQATCSLSDGEGDNDMDALYDYVAAFKRSRDVLAKMYPDVPIAMLDAADRPSRALPQESARIRATVDILTIVNDLHVPGCSRKTDCQCHPVADVSQRADRAKFHVDGTIPTLTTGSKIFSYKLRRMLLPEELLHSMGYSKKSNLTPFPATSKRCLVGNGYCVPVCALAVAAAATVTGHVKKGNV